MEENYKISVEDALAELTRSGKEFINLIAHGPLSVEMYKPHKVDKQSVHGKDEFYVIVSGQGKFKYEEKITDIKPGDFLFVPAGTEHRFLDFTDDFSTWVFFLGSNNF
jgi:mannose-6-phosphate isomerase-like protein (cupin superfamily)